MVKRRRPKLHGLTLEQENKVDDFEKFTVAHPALAHTFDTVLRFIKRPVGCPVILVYGPTGVGKSTILRKIHEHILEGCNEAMEQDKGLIPVAGIEAVAPDKEFHWGDYFYRALLAVEEPLIDFKMSYNARGVKRDSNGAFVVSQRTYNPELRRALEKALKGRNVGVFTIDEAEHMDKMVRGRTEEDQIDIIKSLANCTNTVHILAGTYSLTKFRNLDDQLSRRTINIHLPRYKFENSNDRKSFRSALSGLLKHLPDCEYEILMDNWEFFYERTIGCIGTLKDWLTRALIFSMSHGRTKVTRVDVESTALSVSQCDKIAEITIDGEQRIEQEEQKRDALRAKLGLQRLPEEKEEVRTEKDETKGKPHRNVGERNPHRDPVGIE